MGYSQNTGKEAVWMCSRCSFYMFLHPACSFGSCLIVTPYDLLSVALTCFWGCMLWMPTRKHHCTVLLVRVPAQSSRIDSNDVGIICARTAEQNFVEAFIELNHNPSCYLYLHIVPWTSNSTWNASPSKSGFEKGIDATWKTWFARKNPSTIDWCSNFEDEKQGPYICSKKRPQT